MVERSTVGAAGLSRETATTATVNNTTATPAHTANWRFLLSFKSGRAISIDIGYGTWRAKHTLGFSLKINDLSKASMQR
jgi:hypothetical protein